MSARIPIIGVPCRADASAQYHNLPLFGMGQRYVEDLTEAGAAPVLIPLALPPAAVEATARHLDGILLAGGEDVAPSLYGQVSHPALGRVTPARDELEIALCKVALQRKTPILGICRGIQVLNVATGGTLFQDLASQRPEGLRHDYHFPEFPRDRLSHNVTLQPGCGLAATLGDGDLPVNSMHHQAVRDLAPGLAITARAPDGVIEGVEHPGKRFALAVQWHPEEMVERHPQMRALFSALVAAARR